MPRVEQPKSRKGMKNVYLCKVCGHGFVSQDIDDGTTPFLAQCLNPYCDQLANSLCYQTPQIYLADTSPAVEWYRPSDAEIADEAPSIIEHVKRGGLLPRLTKEKGQ